MPVNYLAREQCDSLREAKRQGTRQECQAQTSECEGIMMAAELEPTMQELKVAQQTITGEKQAILSASTTLRSIRLGDKASVDKVNSTSGIVAGMAKMSVDQVHSTVTDALTEAPKELLIPIVLMELRRSEQMQRNMHAATERHEALCKEMQQQVQEKEQQLSMALSTLRRVHALFSATAHVSRTEPIEQRLQDDETPSCCPGSSLDHEALICTVDDHMRAHRAAEAQMNETSTQCDALQRQLAAVQDELVHVTRQRAEMSSTVQSTQQQLEQLTVQAQGLKTERDELYHRSLDCQEQQTRQSDEAIAKLNVLAVQLATESAGSKASLHRSHSHY